MDVINIISISIKLQCSFSRSINIVGNHGASSASGKQFFLRTDFGGFLVDVFVDFESDSKYSCNLVCLADSFCKALYNRIDRTILKKSYTAIERFSPIKTYKLCFQEFLLAAKLTAPHPEPEATKNLNHSTQELRYFYKKKVKNKVLNICFLSPSR